MKKNLFISSILVILLFSCAQPVPNPIIGAYTMPNYTFPELDDGALALKNDGTFVYIEQISSSSEYRIRIDGTYKIAIYSYNFTAADGLITFSVPDGEIPSNISNLLLNTGANSFLFDWTCDKNTGPISLTLVVDPEDPARNFEFEYAGATSRFDDIESILPDDLISDEEGDEDSGNEGEDQEPNPDDPEDTDPTDPETPPEENPEDSDEEDTEENPEVPDSGEGEDTEVPDEGTGTDTDTPEEEPAE